MNMKAKLVIAGCMIAASSMLAGVLMASSPMAVSSDRSSGNAVQVVNPGITTDFTKAAESTINGVVSIKSFVSRRNTRSMQQGFFDDPFFDFFFGGPRRSQPRRQEPEEDPEDAQQELGLGSGVILTNDGYIVTNNHVINGADRLEVTLNDNRVFNATVVGNDEMTDLALIKIDAEDLPVIPMGDSNDIKVGEWVLAVGNPFGFTSTVTTGIVSAKARSISSATHGRPMGVEAYIQTDAAVNPGNSGGALVNLNGELVGINTAIYSQSGNYAGCSFAIPTTIVRKVADDLKQYGAVQRAFLGVSFQPLTQKLAQKHDITATNSGIYVMSVQESSAAEEAGLKEGDVIVAINNAPTLTEAQLREQVNRYSPGDVVTVTYFRDNKKQFANLKLLNNSGSTRITRVGDSSELGCTFGEVSKETLAQLKIKNGVEVTKLSDGKFASAGIKSGFIILEINNQPVRSVREIESLYKAIMKSDGYDKVMFISGIYPTGKKAFYAVNLDE